MADVLWLEWATIAAQEGTPDKAGDLKYIFRHDISTENTRFIIESAVGAGDNDFVSDWPGTSFTMGQDQFEALIGTVHGVSIVTLITTHPNERGTKSIAKVTIFTTFDEDEGEDSYHMLWTLTE